MSWRVAVDLSRRHHNQGNRFKVRIELMMPGEELAVTHGSDVRSKQHLDEEEWVKQFDVESMRRRLRAVIKDAFDVAQRRLQAYARRHRRLCRSTGRRRRERPERPRLQHRRIGDSGCLALSSCPAYSHGILTTCPVKDTRFT
jgi:hypothetical protein